MTKQILKLIMVRLTLVSVCVLYLAGCPGTSHSDRTPSRARHRTAPSRCTRCRRPTSAAGAAAPASCLSGARSIPLRSAGSASAASASPPSMRRARCTTSATSGSSPAPMARPATALRRHGERRRSLAAERVGRDHAPEGEARGADAQPRGRRRRHLNAPVSGADAGVGKELCKIPDLIKSQFIVAEAG